MATWLKAARPPPGSSLSWVRFKSVRKAEQLREGSPREEGGKGNCAKNGIGFYKI